MELKGKRIAILAEDTYQELELWYPLLRMREAGAEVTVVGMPGVREYRSKLGYPVKVDRAVDTVSADGFDAVIVPGGYAPDRMRRHQQMLDLVRGVFERGGIVATICHAAWVPISAGIIKGKRSTCVSAIKDYLINAGATYLDQEVVQDGNLITSRVPRDLPAFCRTIIAALR
ncbi:MAG: type 1 glutamine amidotransferase [Anaerolineales bacterium]|nr:MAG: type 1 glutamine amidotransferase [Anaerolineales bacterium]